jgi:hypothetical protein
MTSAWWLLVAFIAGGSAGIFLMALMRVAGDGSEALQFESQCLERKRRRLG